MDLNFYKLNTRSKSPLWIFPQLSAKSVALGVLIFAGTRDENWPKEAGLGHALEHMHFQGTEKFPSSDKVSGYIEEVGGRLNAWTWKEMTFYHIHLPAEHFLRGVEILSQQIRASVFPKEKIAIEMKNIVQEIRRRNDNPGRFIYKVNGDLIYKDHPLGKDTLGTEESVAAFRREDFINFKQRYYNSNNIVFIAAGKIEENNIANVFDEFFSFVPGEKNVRAEVKLSDSVQRTRIESKDIEQVHLILSALTGAAKSEDASYLELFGYMISGGMSFPLFQEVRDKKGLCYEIHAMSDKWSDFGNLNIYVGTDLKRYKEAVDTILDVVQKSKSDRVLLEKAKRLRIGRLALNFENMSNVIGIAARDITFLDSPRGYDQIKSEIEKININDIERVVDKYLSKEKIYTSMLVPKGFKE